MLHNPVALIEQIRAKHSSGVVSSLDYDTIKSLVNAVFDNKYTWNNLKTFGNGKII